MVQQISQMIAVFGAFLADIPLLRRCYFAVFLLFPARSER
jgi:hypothetical protein